MNQRSSSLPARAIAVAALACGFLVIVVVLAASLGGDNGDASGTGAKAGKGAKRGGGARARKPPKSYVVQNGDTLTSIGHKFGVPVRRIEELNPGVDPQILVSGEKLKLR